MSVRFSRVARPAGRAVVVSDMLGNSRNRTSDFFSPTRCLDVSGGRRWKNSVKLKHVSCWVELNRTKRAYLVSWRHLPSCAAIWITFLNRYTITRIFRAGCTSMLHWQDCFWSQSLRDRQKSLEMLGECDDCWVRDPQRSTLRVDSSRTYSYSYLHGNKLKEIVLPVSTVLGMIQYLRAS